jgi:hypothetical protein
MAVLESRLVIAGDDLTGPMFASIQAKMDALDGRIGTINATIGRIGAATKPPAVVQDTTKAVDDAKAKTQAASGGMLNGLAGFVAAITGFEVVTAAWEQKAEQLHEEMRQKLAAMSPEEIAEGEKIGADIASHYPSVAQSDVMHTLRSVRTVTGSYDEAKGLVEDITKLRTIAQAANPQASPEQMTEEMDKLIKAMEIAGVTNDPVKFGRYINDIAKALNAFGDQLKPEDYFEQLRYARAAGQTISERFLMTTMATLGTEVGGQSIGTAVAAFNQALVGGRMTHQAALGFADLGLVNDEDLLRTKTGEVKGVKRGSHVKDWRLAQSDPDLWIKQDLLPALAAKGVTDPAEIQSAISQLFSNRLAAQLASMIANQPVKLEKNAKLWSDASGKESADTLTRGDPYAARKGALNTLTRGLAKIMPVQEATDVSAAVSMSPGEAAFPWLGAPDEVHTSKGSVSRSDVLGALKDGWRALLGEIQIGPPQIGGSGQAWQNDIHAYQSLYGAGYRNGDLEAEEARERSRGLAMGGAHGPLDVTGKVTLDPNSKAEVDVNVHVETDSLLKFVADAVATATGNLAAHVGRMDTDASPRRSGGIGHM